MFFEKWKAVVILKMESYSLHLKSCLEKWKGKAEWKNIKIQENGKKIRKGGILTRVCLKWFWRIIIVCCQAESQPRCIFRAFSWLKGSLQHLYCKNAGEYLIILCYNYHYHQSSLYMKTRILVIHWNDRVSGIVEQFPPQQSVLMDRFVFASWYSKKLMEMKQLAGCLDAYWEKIHL